jgi:glutaredoxin
MKQLILYSTLGCHLCEQAKSLAEPVLADRAVELREVDIADSEDLMEAYGVRIPVLQDADTKAELGWPFDTAALTVWLSALPPK